MKKIRLVIEYEYCDLNTYVDAERGNRYVGNSIKSAETLATYAIVRSMKLKPIKVPCSIEFQWYLRNKKKDPDNVAFAKKFILDGLVKAGLLENDGCKQITEFRDTFFFEDKKDSKAPFRGVILVLTPQNK